MDENGKHLDFANVFDYFERAHGDSQAPFAARAPRRPSASHDLKLFPRRADWAEDGQAQEALSDAERQPWVDRIEREGSHLAVRLSDSWVEARGAALESGGSEQASLSGMVDGGAYVVQFWDANATKALHVGHLRNLAIGNAISSSLAQAGAVVERRSLIADAGRSMGEAMAGIAARGRDIGASIGSDMKSDHFVGACYADYVASVGRTDSLQGEPAEDSLARELTLRNDAADELLQRALSGNRDALELWYKTRAWVISGQRKTLSDLGVAFDRVFFESDFLHEAADLTERGLREGMLHRREDGVIVYASGLSEFEEFPLVRADGLPTQHMRSLAYWITAPELGDAVSMQVCGSEWVAHVTCRRQLIGELLNGGGDGQHPSLDIFNGMVTEQKRVLASSDGALLIDDLLDWIEASLSRSEELRRVMDGHPCPEEVVARIALGYFLPEPVGPRLDFEIDRLLLDGESLGWDLVRAQAKRGTPSGRESRPAESPAYRFATVQAELYRRYLRLAVERYDVRPIALYVKHLAAWYLEGEHEQGVERIVHTALARAARGLGLEALA